MYKISIILTLCAVKAPASTIVYTFDTSQGLGRRFDGIGGLSAGASSKLLVNYPEKQRDEILDLLFRPNYGANFHILKVEIGGDAQSTDGTEASHMHYPWDKNYQRGYEWWLMKEAKMRNPDIKLYGLPWGFPGWVANYTENPYADRQQLAMYIVNWIKGAKTEHNLDIDYIGIWNERKYDIEYVITLRKTLDENNLSSVLIIAADDFNWDQISADIFTHPEFNKAVYGIGIHYPGTKSSVSAVDTGKPLWSSEDFSTVDDVVGGGCWARLLNMNYVNGLMTSTISWSLIASWYNGLPYSGAGLMTAFEPWSGHYQVTTPLWVSAHTNQFAKPGWHYLAHGKGVGNFTFGGSFVSLQSPDEQDFTIVIETISHNMSVCIRPYLPPYTVQNQTVVIKLEGPLKIINKLSVWYSKLSKEEPSSMLIQKTGILVTDGQFQMDLGIDEIWTLTTVTTGAKAKREPPPSKPFPVPYFDDFENSSEFSEPNNLTPQLRSYEVLRNSTTQNQFIRQTSLHNPVEWCGNDNHPRSFAIIGSNDLKHIGISVKFNLDIANATDGVFLSTRVNATGCASIQSSGVFFSIYPKLSKFVVSSDFEGLHPLQEGTLTKIPVYSRWNELELQVAGNYAWGSLNNKELFDINNIPDDPSMGFVGLGTTEYGLADFDDLRLFEPKQDIFKLKFSVVV
ncbi:hypothetical protein LOTGIDRAFT_195251 [Lottia gigantea]|uniref:galactosylceramidase n=1 Tax=Lottia gigantea TaxID=225164 RepID=V4BAX6_LOTGI|nr:hypothetical protein LOTGIDRAFT_195251 [Lottia gigantea]ESO86134.1 hypothetical protein LOTGIDRAFT_195251 [Lottia gigantea]